MTGLTFLILFLVVMSLLALVPQLVRRYHIPGIVAMMLVGIVIGPNGLDLIRLLGGLMGRGYPIDQLYTILDAMGLLGLVFLMALAGMEVDLGILSSEKKAVGWLSLLTFAIPALAGYYVYDYFRPHDVIGKLLYASLFASHSVGIVFPVIRELKVVQTRFGVAVLASTVITDLASLILLAVCVQMKRHTLHTRIGGSISIFDHINMEGLGIFFFVLFLLSIAIYIILAVWLVPLIGNRIFRRLHPGDDARLTFFLVAVLMVVFLGELIGVNIIVGAFVAGMALIRCRALHEKERVLHHKLEGLGYGLLIPILFLTLGMKTDLRILFSAWENAAVVLLTVIGLISSKVLSGWLALRLSGFSNAKGLCAGLMTIPQLSATLAAAAVGLELQIIEPSFFNAIVCLSIVTTLPVPTLVKLLILRLNIQFDRVEDQLRVPLPSDELDEDLI